MESIPIEERSTYMNNLDLDKFPVKCAVCVTWDIESDILGFQIVMHDIKSTRRRLLSVVISIYDPIGLVSPLVSPAK